MVDAITAVGRCLADFEGHGAEARGSKTLPAKYLDGARAFLSALAEDGHWVAPWEASDEMMKTIERHIKPRQWTVLREIVLKGQRAE